MLRPYAGISCVLLVAALAFRPDAHRCLLAAVALLEQVAGLQKSWKWGLTAMEQWLWVCALSARPALWAREWSDAWKSIGSRYPDYKQGISTWHTVLPQQSFEPRMLHCRCPILFGQQAQWSCKRLQCMH